MNILGGSETLWFNTQSTSLGLQGGEVSWVIAQVFFHWNADVHTHNDHLLLPTAYLPQCYKSDKKSLRAHVVP